MSTEKLPLGAAASRPTRRVPPVPEIEPEPATARPRSARRSALARALEDLRGAGGMGEAPIPAPASDSASRPEPSLEVLLEDVAPVGSPAASEESAERAEVGTPERTPEVRVAAGSGLELAHPMAELHAMEPPATEPPATVDTPTEVRALDAPAFERQESNAPGAAPQVQEERAAGARDSFAPRRPLPDSTEQLASDSGSCEPQLQETELQESQPEPTQPEEAQPEEARSSAHTPAAAPAQAADAAAEREVLADHQLEPVAPDAGAAPPDRRVGSGGLDNTLTATIRRWARPTTPQELEARGVKRLRSVSMSRIAALIEKAINRELIARTLDGDSDDALSLSSDARAGFLELARSEMSGRVDAESESSAFANLDRLRAELDARRAELEEREQRRGGVDPGDAEAAVLERRLREVFASRPGGRDLELEREVIGAVHEEVDRMRARAREVRLAEERRETRQLERRIAKLSGLLEQTEEELRRTRARRAQDPGVASMFDEVQGLDGGDERFEQKLGLMKSIFEANLELQH